MFISKSKFNRILDNVFHAGVKQGVRLCVNPLDADIRSSYRGGFTYVDTDSLREGIVEPDLPEEFVNPLTDFKPTEVLNAENKRLRGLLVESQAEIMRLNTDQKTLKDAIANRDDTINRYGVTIDNQDALIAQLRSEGDKDFLVNHDKTVNNLKTQLVKAHDEIVKLRKEREPKAYCVMLQQMDTTPMAVTGDLSLGEAIADANRRNRVSTFNRGQAYFTIVEF